MDPVRSSAARPRVSDAVPLLGGGPAGPGGAELKRPLPVGSAILWMPTVEGAATDSPYPIFITQSACTAAKALCVMKIGYGESVAAPSTVGIQRIAEPTGNGRLSSAPPGPAGPPPRSGTASETRGRAALLRTGSILTGTLQLPRRGCGAQPPKPAAPPWTTTA